MRKLYTLPLIAFLMVVIIPLLHSQSKIASPIQMGHYMPGYMNIRDWSAIPAGLQILDYNAYYWGSKYYDKNGKEVKSIQTLGNNHIDLNVNISGYSTVPTVFWGSSFKILKGARYFAGGWIDYSTFSSAAAYQRIGFITDSLILNGNVSGKTNGFGDLTLVPVGFSWELKRVDLSTWYTLYTPTGRYSTGADDNMGYGFWTNQVQFSANIYPFFQGDEIRATDFMICPSIEFNSKIKDIDVKPGSRFSLDYGISQYLTDQLEIGVYGGNNWQIGEDKGNKVYWDPSVKDKVGTVGGLIGYWPVIDRLYISIMYSINYGMVQTIKTNAAQINLYFDANCLKKKEKK